MILKYGDLVMLIDNKGRKKTIKLEREKKYFSHSGAISHDDLVGLPDASIVKTDKGMKYLALTPALKEYTLGMKRGATIIYPKDAAIIIGFADLYPGAKVLEAGVGSGALSASILRAIGPTGELFSYERREDFARIARENVLLSQRGKIENWHIVIGDVAEATESGFTHIILDMLEPWEPMEVLSERLLPGGHIAIYVATTTQLSVVVEKLRALARFTEPEALEIILRPWHLDGLAVRPEHKMNGHTGFLVFARKMADGNTPLALRRKFTRDS